MIESIEPEQIEIPAVGQSFVDPAFGSRITRISDAKAEGVTFVGPEYSSVNPFNCANTKLLLIKGDHFGLYEGWSGRLLQELKLDASLRPRWSKREPDIVYYIVDEQVWYLNVATGHEDILKEFTEFEKVDDLGECDLVMDADGNHWWALCGVRDGFRSMFLFNVDKQKAGPRRMYGHGIPIDSLMVTPDLNVLISFNEAGEGGFRGIWIYDRGMVNERQVTRANGHKNVCRDASGDEVMIWHNSAEPLPNTCKGGSIVKVRLADGQQTELLNLDWKTIAVNVSTQDHGPALISTYAESNSPWCSLMNELFLLPLDGGEVRRLAHTRSVGDGYYAQPRGTIRPDGKAAVFSTNFGDPTKDYSDAMLLEIP